MKASQYGYCLLTIRFCVLFVKIWTGIYVRFLEKKKKIVLWILTLVVDLF